MSDSIIRHAVCDLCDNEAKGTVEELISKGWFMGMMGETCPADHWSDSVINQFIATELQASEKRPMDKKRTAFRIISP